VHRSPALVLIAGDRGYPVREIRGTALCDTGICSVMARAEVPLSVHGEELPFSGYACESVRAAVVESDTGAGDEIDECS
jgi:hypothetical protein